MAAQVHSTAEISELDLMQRSDEEVRWFNVKMYDVFRVDMLKTQKHFAEKLPNFRLTHHRNTVGGLNQQ
jgi:hypothetical protein